MPRVVLEGAIAAVIAMVAGVGLGTATVSGVRPAAASPGPSYPTIGSGGVDGYAAADVEQPWQEVSHGYRPAAALDEAAAPDCTDCGDYQAGWRWAEMSGFTDVSSCMVDSWTFQRGCAAWVRERNAA